MSGGEPGAARRSGFSAAFAAVPLLVAAFHAQAIRPGQAFLGSDLRHFFFAMRELFRRSVLAGELPLWQRGYFAGFPALADPQLGFFDFAQWLLLPVADPARAVTLTILVHLVVAGWGMVVWARERELSPAAGLLAAVVFALGGVQTAHLLHWTFAASTCFWPWMLAGVDGFIARGKGRYLVLTTLAAAGSWFGGSPQMAYLGTLLAGAQVLVHLPALWARRPLDAVLALLAAPLGFLVAAPLDFPAVELALLGPRGDGVAYAFSQSGHWDSPWELALLVLPRAFGMGWAFSGPLGESEITGYLGILPMALLAAAPLRRRATWLLVLVAALSVVVAFGDSSPLNLHWLLCKVLPGFGSFRNPTRLMLLGGFAGAMAAAEALDALASDRARGRLVIAAALVLGLAGPALLFLKGAPWIREEALRSAGIALLAAGGTLLVVWLLRRGRRFAPAAVVVALLDLFASFGDANPAAPAFAEVPVLSDFARFVPRAPAPRRVAVIAAWGKTANDPLRQDWESVTGYGPTMIQRVRALLEGSASSRLAWPGPVTEDHDLPRPDPASPWWPLFATDLVVADHPLPLPELAFGPAEILEPLRLHRAAALPRVYWVGEYRVSDDAVADAWLADAARGDIAILAEAPAGAAHGARAGPVAADDVRLGSRTLDARLEAPRDGLAVVLDPWFPGWTAAVDGVAVPVFRANFAFMAIPVTAGSHALHLSYRSRLFELGLYTAPAALGMLSLLCLYRRRYE